MEKIYKCFISSTFRDLEEERRRVIEAVLDYHQLPVGMENFNASDDTQWVYITRMLKDCDYFIVIVAHNYGTVGEDGISYTEKETRYALEQGIPVLPFILSKKVKDWPHERYERVEESRIKLEEFKEFLTTDRMARYWEDKNDLAAKVTASLRDAIQYHPRPGYIRCGEDGGVFESPSSRREPKFAIEFSDWRQLEFVGQPEIKIDFSWLGKKKQLDMLEHVKELSFGVPSQIERMVTERDIEDWNHSVPKLNRQIDRYNKEVEEHNRHLASVGVRFSITNIGTLRAHDLTVTMEFPEWIEVLDCRDGKEEPRKPDGIINPVRKALDRLKDMQSPVFDSNLAGMMSPMLGAGPQIPDLSMYGKRATSFCIESPHVAEYAAESLQHGSSLECESLYLLPDESVKKSGTVMISCRCDEFPKPQIIEIPISIGDFAETGQAPE